MRFGRGKPPDRASSKEPAIGDGFSQGGNGGTITRLAPTLSDVIHTQPQLRCVACVASKRRNASLLLVSRMLMSIEGKKPAAKKAAKHERSTRKRKAG